MIKMLQTLYHEGLQNCIRRFPVAIEAAVALAEQGVSYEDIVSSAPILSARNIYARANTSFDDQDGRHHQQNVQPLLNTPAIAADANRAGADVASNASDPTGAFGSPMLCSASALVNVESHNEDVSAGHLVWSTAYGNGWAHETAAVPVGDASSGMSARLHSGRPAQPTSWQRSPMQDTLQVAGGNGGLPTHAAYEQRHACDRIGVKALARSVQQTHSVRSIKRRKLQASQGSVTGYAAQSHCVSDESSRSADMAERVCRLDGAVDLASGRGGGAALVNVPVPVSAKVSRIGSRYSGAMDTTAVPKEGETIESPVKHGMQQALTCTRKDCCPALHQLNPEDLRKESQRGGFSWCGLLISGHVHLFNSANLEAATMFSALASLFPDELCSVLGAAAALLAAGDQVGAISTFQRARVLDPLNVHGMDTFACVLLERGSREELRLLSHDMSAVDLSLPEVWAVMACFWQQKGDWSKALDYVNRCAPCPLYCFLHLV
jgi:hypothetical protein